MQLLQPVSRPPAGPSGPVHIETAQWTSDYVERMGSQEMTMAVDLRTRKPVDTLSLGDLSDYPVWEFASDEEGVEGRDETWVRPVATGSVPRRSYTLVAASFQTRRGREINGYETVSTLEGMPDIPCGTILEGGRPYFVPNPEAACYREAWGELIGGLGLTEAELSRLAYTLKVPIEGTPGPFHGELRLLPPAASREVQLGWW